MALPKHNMTKLYGIFPLSLSLRFLFTGCFKFLRSLSLLSCDFDQSVPLLVVQVGKPDREYHTDPKATTLLTDAVTNKHCLPS